MIIHKECSVLYHEKSKKYVAFEYGACNGGPYLTSDISESEKFDNPDEIGSAISCCDGDMCDENNNTIQINEDDIIAIPVFITEDYKTQT